MKKKWIAVVLAVLMIPTIGAPASAAGFENFNFAAEAIHFLDVPESAWYYNDVSRATAAGIINGMGNQCFNPSGTLTYAEAMTLMAKIHAVYNGETELLARDQATPGPHWVSGIFTYCTRKNLPGTDPKNYDTPISRASMAYYFICALPKEARGPINDLSLLPEQIRDMNVKFLFQAGVMMGDESGFRLRDNITRAEAAAIIHRLINPAVRVKLPAKEDVPPAVPMQPTPPLEPLPAQVEPPAASLPATTEHYAGQLQTAKPYTRIPNTAWTIDPTRGVEIYSRDGYIKTKYGNHDYGAKNQEQYERLLSVLDEAFAYACNAETTRIYRRPLLETLARPNNKQTKFYTEKVGIADLQQIANMQIIEGVVWNMQSYLNKTYAAPNGAGKNPDAQNNDVYKYLFAGGKLDCDGWGRLNMMCWDYLGFSTRMISSHDATHAVAQVYVNGKWILAEQETGDLYYCTHEQLMELFSGVENDIPYSQSSSVDPFITQAIRFAKEQIAGSKYPYDMFIEWGESPTHDPDNRSL